MSRSAILNINGSALVIFQLISKLFRVLNLSIYHEISTDLSFSIRSTSVHFFIIETIKLQIFVLMHHTFLVVSDIHYRLDNIKKLQNWLIQKDRLKELCNFISRLF
jgi:hypothetical protein